MDPTTRCSQFLNSQLSKKRDIRKIWPAKLIPEDQAYIDELTRELTELDQRLAQLATQTADVQKEMAEKKAMLDNLDSLKVAVPSEAATEEIVQESQAETGFTLKSIVSMTGEVIGIYCVWIVGQSMIDAAVLRCIMPWI